MTIPLTQEDITAVRDAGLDDLADRLQEILKMDFWREVIEEVIDNDTADGMAYAEWANG